MSSPIETVDLFASRRFSPKQAELIEKYREAREARALGDDAPHIFAVVWGRRCGKSDGCSSLFAEILADIMDDLAVRIADPDDPLQPWRGLGKKRGVQRKSKPHAKALVTAPSARDLNEISGFLLDVFRDEAEVYLHPDQSMQVDANGARMWFVKDGAALSVEFIPAVSKSSMVGRGWAAVMTSESGFIPSVHWDRLSPALWDQSPWVVCEGTPEQDPSHWFTQVAVSGLEDDHEEADRTIAQRNPAVWTSRANTIEHAFLKTARTRAQEEAVYRGKRWEDRWVHASWKAPSDVVFDEWREDRSVVELIKHPLAIRHPQWGEIPLPHPSKREIDVDWHNGGDPGACICTYIWLRNPLDPQDRTRPLFLVVAEFEDDEKRLPYAKGGWWDVLTDMRDLWSVRKIFGDPAGTKLLRYAKRAGLRIKPADNEDKNGRLEAINSLCTIPDTPSGKPALLVSSECPKLIARMNVYHWKVDPKTDLPTSKASQYDDHLTDCLAYTGGRYAKGPSAPIGR